jgi:hypothetical protein
VLPKVAYLSSLELYSRSALATRTNANVDRHDLYVLPRRASLTCKARVELITVLQGPLCLGEIGQGGVYPLLVRSADDDASSGAGAGDDVGRRCRLCAHQCGHV